MQCPKCLSRDTVGVSSTDKPSPEFECYACGNEWNRKDTGLIDMEGQSLFVGDVVYRTAYYSDYACPTPREITEKDGEFYLDGQLLKTLITNNKYTSTRKC